MEGELFIEAKELFFKSQYNEAIAIYEKLRDDPATQSVVTYRIGLADYFRGNQDDGLKAIAQALEMRDQSSVGTHLEAISFYCCQLKDLESSLEIFARFEDIFPTANVAPFIEHLAPLAVEQEHYDLSFDLSSRLVKLQPENSDAWMYLGISQFFFAEYEKSVNSLEKACQLNPENREAWYALGRSAAKSNDEDLFKKSCETLVEMGAFLELAMIHHEDGNTQKSADFFSKMPASQRTPLSCFQHSERLYALGRFEEGVQVVERGLAIDPEDVYCLCTKAELLSHLDQFNEASLLFKKCIEFTPDYHFVHERLARHLYRTRDFQLAIQAADRAIQLEPNSFLPIVIRAKCLFALGDKAHAVGYCSEMIDTMGPIPSFLVTLAWILLDSSNGAPHHSDIELGERLLKTAKERKDFSSYVVPAYYLQAKAALLKAQNKNCEATEVYKELKTHRHLPVWQRE